MMRRCRTCGELFSTQIPTQLYCCKECRNFAIELANKKYMKQPPKNKKIAKDGTKSFTMDEVVAVMRKFDVQYVRALEILENTRHEKIGAKKQNAEK